MMTAVEALGADERGVLLGLLCAGVDGSAMARLAGAGVDRCRAAFEAWAALSEGDREAERAALVAWLEASPPPGLERVHPGWIRRALENEPSALVRAVAGGLTAEAARVADELLRARGDEPDLRGPAPDGPGLRGAHRVLFAALAPMPTADHGPPRARALCALGGAALLDEIDRRGAETLGRALAGAPDAVVARAAAGVGDPLARVVLAAARGRESAVARAAARALVAGAPSHDGGAARAIGLHAVARDLADEGAAALAAVAQRLPPAVGEALLACASVAEAG